MQTVCMCATACFDTFVRVYLGPRMGLFKCPVFKCRISVYPIARKRFDCMLLGVRCIQFQMWWMLYLRPTCMISYEVDLTGVTYSIHGNAHIHGFLIGLLWVSLEGESKAVASRHDGAVTTFLVSWLGRYLKFAHSFGCGVQIYKMFFVVFIFPPKFLNPFDSF